MEALPNSTRKSTRNFKWTLALFSVLFIAGGLIEWYAVDWKTFFSPPVSTGKLPEALLFYARLVDLIQGPLAHARHWCLQRATGDGSNFLYFTLQFLAALILPLLSATMYAWFVSVLIDPMRTIIKPWCLRTIKAAFPVAFLLFGALSAIFFLPPWWGNFVWTIHDYTGIPFFFGEPPKHFTGVWLMYSPDLSFEFSYKDGKRHGPQRYYGKAHELAFTSEFKDGEPWSGWCEWWPGHPFMGEFREGQPWRGYIEGRYYIDGDSVDPAAFRWLALKHNGAW